MRGSRDAELRRARVAALIALAALASAGCSGDGQDDGNGRGAAGDRAARPPGAHRWTSSPCDALANWTPAEGFTLGSTTDSADPDAREDVGANGARPRFRTTGCLADLTARDGTYWKLSSTASLYEDAAPARHAYRVKLDLDRAHGRGPRKMHAAAYWLPTDDQGRPGRTLLLWNGDLLLSVSAYAAHGSAESDVHKDLGRIVENAARRMEDGLRDAEAASAAP